MKMLLIIFCTLMMVSVAQAAMLDTSGLSEQQRSELALQVAKLKATSTLEQTIQKVSEWVSIGPEIGELLPI